jgi:hypothetical protein
VLEYEEQEEAKPKTWRRGGPHLRWMPAQPQPWAITQKIPVRLGVGSWVVLGPVFFADPPTS